MELLFIVAVIIFVTLELSFFCVSRPNIRVPTVREPIVDEKDEDPLTSIVKQYQAKTGAILILMYGDVDKSMFDKLYNEIYSKDVSETVSDIHIMLESTGGNMHYARYIVKLFTSIWLRNRIHIFVPRRALSAGTLIALSAKNINMNELACLGKIDPQYVFGETTYNINTIKRLNIDKMLESDDVKQLIYGYDLSLARDNLMDSVKHIQIICDDIYKSIHGSQCATNIQNILADTTTSHYIKFEKAELERMGLEIGYVPREMNDIICILDKQ